MSTNSTFSSFLTGINFFSSIHLRLLSWFRRNESPDDEIDMLTKDCWTIQAYLCSGYAADCYSFFKKCNWLFAGVFCNTDSLSFYFCYQQQKNNNNSNERNRIAIKRIDEETYFSIINDFFSN